MKQDALADAAEGVGLMVVAAKQAVKALESASREADDGSDRVGGGLLSMLSEHARQLHSETEELGRRLAGARRRLGGDEALPAREVPGPEPVATESPPALPSDAEEPAEAATPSAGIRMLVNQMVAVGATRLEIEERLRDLGIANTAAVLSSVLDRPGEPGGAAP